MTITELYLTCFLVGFLLSALSLLVGGIHLHLHLPMHFHIGDVGHVAHGGAGAADLPAIDFGTVTAFLAWFGGIGYLLTRYSHMWAVGALLVAIFGGMIGAAIVFFVIGKTLMRSEQNLDPADYDMVGVLGRVTGTIREGGTGEIVFTQQGVRKACAARSESGEAIPREEEVVVTRFDRGIAYVRRWDELAESAGLQSNKLEQ